MELSELIETIVSNLQKNGFPSKKVSFPTASLESFIQKHEFDVSAVLSEMENDDIFHTRKDDRLLFSSTPPASNSVQSEDPMAALKDKDPAKIREEAEKVMSQMTPEQLKEIEERVKNMSPEEVAKLKEMARSMGFS